MFSVSSGFVSAIKNASREFRSKVLIGEDEYSDDKVINLILEKSMAPSDEFSLGAVVASKFELTISLADIRNNKIIKPYLGLRVGKDFEYVPLGVFNIEEKSIQNGVVNIKCFDNIGKFEKPYFSDLNYPTTIQRVANEICSKAGVTLATTLPTLNIDRKIDGYTCREALSFIASACGGFAIANRAGAIEIKNVGPSTSSINGDNYFTFENDDAFVIKKLTAHIDENTVISRGEGIGVEEIEFKNPIANNQIMDHIYSKLKNYTYVPGNLVWQGSPVLDVGDKMSVTDISGIKRDILIMRDKITYSGGLRGETNSVAKSLGKSNFNYGGSMQGAVDRVTAEQIVVKELLADKASISDLNAINANIENLKVSKADIEQLQATNANIENLKANKANISDLNATNAIITNLQATKADIVDLTAATGKITVLESEVAKIGVLEGDVANIQDIVSGNISSDNIQSGGITGDRLNMNTIFVNDANIVNINASKVNAGEIDTSKVKVKSADGAIEIVGATQQFRDKNNKVRIQMGKDAKGEFNFIIKGEDGTTTLIDHTGIKENAIADDLIKDSMIAPDAVGEKQIDYNSFSTGFNKDTNTSQIKGTKVRLDNQNQSLEVAFTSLKSQADGTKTQTESNTTQINVQQGQISTAIANTKIVKDGKEVLLKDDYNTTVATVNSMKNTISSHTTKIDNNTGKITGVESKTNVLERDLNSMSSKISATEITVKTHTTQINTVTGTANSAIDKANKANEKVDTLEIGGINLLKNTTSTFKEFIANTTEWYKQFGSDIKLEVGFYVISWDCIVLEGYKPYISIGCGTKGNFNRDIAQSNKNMATSKSFVFEVKESHLADDYVYFAYRFRNDKNASKFKVKCEKLEHGTKATSWENISDGIDKNKNDIITVNTEVATTKNKVSGIEQNLDSITTRVGSVESTTTTHTATINSHTSSLNAVDGKINTAKTDAINTSKADATTKANDAKNQALSGAATDAQNKANKALNDAKGYTNVEVTKVNSTMTSKFAEIKTTTDSITQSVSNTNKEVSNVKVSVTNAQNTANNANSKIDGLEVGGRNLLKDSNPKLTTSSYLIRNFNFGDMKPVENERYSISIKGKLGANKSSFGIYNSGGTVQVCALGHGTKGKDGVYRYQNVQWRVGVANNTYISVYSLSSSVTENSTIEWIKLEKGTKATDWIPAPEDVSKEILDITTEKVNQAKADIKITTDSITNRVSNVETKAIKNSKVGSFRYIRDWLNGSSANTGNHWCELEVWVNETNIARGKIVTGSSGLTNAAIVTDGNVAHNAYATAPSGTWQYIQLDLGSERRDVEWIRTFHYWADARAYNHKLEVSKDGVNWIELYNSEVSGTYAESSKGRSYIINASYTTESFSEIKNTSNNIKLEVAKKTDKTSIVSTINMSPEHIKIAAAKLTLDGLVNFNNLRDGTTTISGSNIKTGTINAIDIQGCNIRGTKTLYMAQGGIMACDGNTYIRNLFVPETHPSWQGTGSFTVAPTARFTNDLHAGGEIYTRGKGVIQREVGVAIQVANVGIQNSGNGGHYFLMNGYQSNHSFGVDIWYSDEKFKKNITEIIKETKQVKNNTKIGLELINSIKHYNFNYLNSSNIISCGYIAQDLQVNNNQLVEEVIQQDGSSMLYPKVSTIIPNLSLAIQEQQEQIKSLEARIQLIENTFFKKCLKSMKRKFSKYMKK